MVDVIPGDDQLPCQEDTSVSGARLPGRRMFLLFLPFPPAGKRDRLLRGRDDASPGAAWCSPDKPGWREDRRRPATSHQRPRKVRYLMAVTQLKCLQIPGPLAESEADRVESHKIVDLVERSFPPALALRIDR